MLVATTAASMNKNPTVMIPRWSVSNISLGSTGASVRPNNSQCRMCSAISSCTAIRLAARQRLMRERWGNGDIGGEGGNAVAASVR